MSQLKSLVLAVVLLVFLSYEVCLGQFSREKAVDTLKLFPHHVTVRKTTRSGQTICSASIFREQWLLTSAKCVQDAVSLTFEFQRQFLDNPKGSFSMTTDNSSVYLYPTGYDNIAMVKLPAPLEFSDEVRPIRLHDGFVPIERKLAVMANFPPYENELSYGMFRILSTEKCKSRLKESFNQYQQVCAEAWSHNFSMPCRNLEGSALIIGWPKQPELVGVFSDMVSCNILYPVIYTKVSHYKDWIFDTSGGSYIPTTSAPSTERTTPGRPSSGWPSYSTTSSSSSTSTTSVPSTGRPSSAWPSYSTTQSSSSTSTTSASSTARTTTGRPSSAWPSYSTTQSSSSTSMTSAPSTERTTTGRQSSTSPSYSTTESSSSTSTTSASSTERTTTGRSSSAWPN